MEMGISATQRTNANSLAAPLNSVNPGCPAIQLRTETSVNNKQCRTGARILARATLDILKSYQNSPIPQLTANIYVQIVPGFQVADTQHCQIARIALINLFQREI